MAKILVVDNDQNTLNELGSYLRCECNEVDVTNEGRVAQGLLSRRGYDVIVLDWAQRQFSSQLCSDYRASGGTGWILITSKAGAIEELEAAFDVGADDFLPKPYEMRELSARIRAMLRRRKPCPMPMPMAMPVQAPVF